MSCEHCELTISDERVQGAEYELQSSGCAYARIEYDGDYELVVEEWSWNGTVTTCAVPILYCPWCGGELT